MSASLPRSDRGSGKRWPAWAGPAFLVVAVGVVHRIWLYAGHREAFAALVTANPDWLTMQYLPLDLLRDRLPRALLVLQQTPPVPHLVLGAWARMVGWPHGMARALVAQQAVISIATAVVLLRFLLRLLPGNRWFGVLAACLFLVNTDLIVLEYASLGQLFYENLAMFLALFTAWRLLELWLTGSEMNAFAIGSAAALLALTRASWSAVGPLVLALVWLLAPRGRRSGATALALLPLLVLQGGWIAKNAWVWKRATLQTSSWSGWNLANGMRAAGFEGELDRFVCASGGAGRPAWFVRHVCGSLDFRESVPREVLERDASVEAILGAPNPLGNTGGVAAVFAEYEKTFFAYAVAQPGLVLEKFRRAYHLFWRPPAHFGRFYVALFAVDGANDDPLDLDSTWRLARAGRLPEAELLQSGTNPSHSFQPTRLGTPRVLAPVLLAANVVGVHLLLPIAALAILAHRLRRIRGAGADDRDRTRTGASGEHPERGVPGRRPHASRDAAPVALLVLGSLYAYLAVVANLGEYGENMRFRLAVEPIIWLITISSAVVLWRASIRPWRSV